MRRDSRSTSSASMTSSRSFEGGHLRYSSDRFYSGLGHCHYSNSIRALRFRCGTRLYLVITGRNIMTRRSTLTLTTIALLGLTVSTAPPQTGFAQSDPLIGTWKLNLARSTFSPGPPPRMSRVTRHTARPTSIVMPSGLADPATCSRRCAQHRRSSLRLGRPDYSDSARPTDFGIRI
jgi:hypothetical protein